MMTTAPTEILFLRWVTLTQQKWVIFRERRRYWGGASRESKRPVGMALLLPVSILFDVHAKPPVYSVTTSIVVNASPERVWKNVTVQVVGAILRSEGTACAVRCDRMALPR
jgi:hypothetical protein